MQKEAYTQMWEQFSEKKAQTYLNYKFLPTHRVGLTNFIREWAIFRFLKPRSSDVVADVGCASGRQLLNIASQIKEGVGTDIAEGFVSVANKEKNLRGINNLTFTKSTVEKIPLASAYCDKVVCGEVLEHVHDKDDALRELIRITKQGGLLVISTPNLNADGTWWGRLMRFIGKRSFESLEHFSAEELVKHGDAHVREFTGRTMCEWLRRHGLSVKSLIYVSYIDGPLCDYLIKFPLHVWGARHIIVGIEKILTITRLPLGRHIVVVAEKL